MTVFSSQNELKGQVIHFGWLQVSWIAHLSNTYWLPQWNFPADFCFQYENDTELCELLLNG